MWVKPGMTKVLFNDISKTRHGLDWTRDVACMGMNLQKLTQFCQFSLG